MSHPIRAPTARSFATASPNVEAKLAGELCQCGEPIWVIGSVHVGLSCFTCITGEAVPDNDYEVIAGRGA